MSQPAGFPDAGQRKAFLAKLRRFRDSLPAGERLYLDAMATVAFTPHQPQVEVQGYGWQQTPAGVCWVEPDFYDAGWGYQWEYTAWGAAYTPVATGMWSPGEAAEERDH